MPAAIAIPLISSAIAGGAAVGGAALASHGANKAAKTQANATTEALNFEKQQYAAEQARLQPYRDLGGQAYAKIGKMFGLEGAPPAAAPAPQMSPATAPPAPASQFSFARSRAYQAPTATPGMVKLQGPDGSTRDVPEAQAAALIARGARRVA